MGEREKMVVCARSKLGHRYIWGTHGPNTFDCSGLVGFCFEQATGRSVGYGSVYQYGLGKAVKTPQAGDVGFWDTFGDAPGHNAIYTGQGTIIHAFNEQRGVIESPLPVQNMGGHNRFMGWRNLGFRDAPEQPEPDKPGKEDPPVDTRQMVRFAGTSVDVPLSVPLRVVLLPKGQTNQRPGIAMKPTLYVQHETGNYRPGTDAQNHLEYLQNGAEGQQLSYHFTVDEKEAIQIIPLNEVTWHGGDSGGECNMHGISCEATVQDNNKYKLKIRRNAEELAAAVMQAVSISRIQAHGTCCRNVGSPQGCHLGCPETIMNDGYWPTFEARVQALRTGGGVVTPPPQPIPVYAGLPDWITGDFFEAAFPLADPHGQVTKAVVAWIAQTGKVPYFVEKIDAGQGRNIWRFDSVTFLSDGAKVWKEGGPKA